MKKSIILLVTICVAFVACKKDTAPKPLSSISFVNAIVGSSPLIPKFNGSNFNYSSVPSANKVSYAASTLFSITSGNVGATFIQSSDTLNTVLNSNLSLQEGKIYSLYLTGTTIKPDTVFIQENLPTYSITDSIAGIRFINLSPTNMVSVDIKGQANGSEVSSLAYKARTGFKTYKADRTVASYTFEFRDATSGALLSTYTLTGVNNATTTNTSANTSRRRNQTIALIGGGTVSQSTILIANY